MKRELEQSTTIKANTELLTDAYVRHLKFKNSKFVLHSNSNASTKRCWRREHGPTRLTVDVFIPVFPFANALPKSAKLNNVNAPQNTQCEGEKTKKTLKIICLRREQCENLLICTARTTVVISFSFFCVCCWLVFVATLYRSVAFVFTSCASVYKRVESLVLWSNLLSTDISRAVSGNVFFSSILFRLTAQKKKSEEEKNWAYKFDLLFLSPFRVWWRARQIHIFFPSALTAERLTMGWLFEANTGNPMHTR